MRDACDDDARARGVRWRRGGPSVARGPRARQPPPSAAVVVAVVADCDPRLRPQSPALRTCVWPLLVVVKRRDPNALHHARLPRRRRPRRRRPWRRSRRATMTPPRGRRRRATTTEARRPSRSRAAAMRRRRSACHRRRRRRRRRLPWRRRRRRAQRGAAAAARGSRACINMTVTSSCVRQSAWPRPRPRAAMAVMAASSHVALNEARRAVARACEVRSRARLRRSRRPTNSRRFALTSGVGARLARRRAARRDRGWRQSLVEDTAATAIATALTAARAAERERARLAAELEVTAALGISAR